MTLSGKASCESIGARLSKEKMMWQAPSLKRMLWQYVVAGLNSWDMSICQQTQDFWLPHLRNVISSLWQAHSGKNNKLCSSVVLSNSSQLKSLRNLHLSAQFHLGSFNAAATWT